MATGLGHAPRPAWKTPQRGGPGLSPEPVPGACWGWRRRGASRSRSWRGRLPRRGRGLSVPGAAALVAASTALLKVATSGRELGGGFPIHGPICDGRHLVCSWSPRRYRFHLLTCYAKLTFTRNSVSLFPLILKNTKQLHVLRDVYKDTSRSLLERAYGSNLQVVKLQTRGSV